jgi:hypothetical protein
MPKTSTDTAIALGGPTMGTRWSVLIDDPSVDSGLESRFQCVFHGMMGAHSS